MKRRECLQIIALMSLSAKVIFDSFEKIFYNSNIEKIYNKLPKHIYDINVRPKEDPKLFVNAGRGIVIDDKFYTPAHVTDVGRRMIPTPMGVIEIRDEGYTRESILKGRELEEVIWDLEQDISVLNLPRNLKLPSFPTKIGKARLGDEIYIIGNPHGKGVNIRKTHVSRISTDLFGTGKAIIPGDSGCPIVNKDLELIGLCNFQFAQSLGYATHIDSYLNYKPKMKMKIKHDEKT